MAIVAPGVEYRQLSGKSHTALTHDIICAHTMVGTLEGSIAWSARPGNSYWHFGIGGRGKIVQCQDLAYRSAANLNGNWHVIPIETADMDEGVFPTPWANPLWTQQQIDALVDLISWLCVRFNIPPVLIPDTRPGRRGLAYHQQGIDPWRVSGGELWSSADGKICPANRIAQFINIVIPAVQARVNGLPPKEDEEVKGIICDVVLEDGQTPDQEFAGAWLLLEGTEWSWIKDGSDAGFMVFTEQAIWGPGGAPLHMKRSAIDRRYLKAGTDDPRTTNVDESKEIDMDTPVLLPDGRTVPLQDVWAWGWYRADQLWWHHTNEEHAPAPPS